MKNETKELAGMFGAALVVVVALALAYRVVVRLWPPAETQHQTLLQFARGLQKPAMRPRSSGSSVTVWIVAGMDLRKTEP